jgi:predicted DNA-binding protein with PD1-like motif
MKTFAIRLTPSQDLKTALEQTMSSHQLNAGIVLTCVGSLQTVALRFANQNETTFLSGPFEIISMAGTLSQTGCHLHLATADGKGNMVGGHLMPGSLIRTTAEIVIAELPQTNFSREFDMETGYNELKITSIP